MKEWKKVKLGEVCSKIGSGATPKGGAMVYINYGTSLIRSQNVYNLSFEYDEINPETSEVTKKNASIDSSVDIANISSGYILGKFDITGYNINAETLLKLTVKSVVASDVEIPINSSSTFRFGR